MDVMNASFYDSPEVRNLLEEMGRFTESVGVAMHDAAQQASSALQTHVGIETRPETAAVFTAGGVFVVAFILGLIVRAKRVVSQRRRRRHNALAVRLAQDAPEDDRDEHEYETRNDVRAAAPGDSDVEDDVVTRKGVYGPP